MYPEKKKNLKYLVNGINTLVKKSRRSPLPSENIWLRLKNKVAFDLGLKGQLGLNHSAQLLSYDSTC